MAGFLVDEDLPWRLAKALEEAGHVALHVTDVQLRGHRDETVFSYAQARGLALVTCDMGYSDIRRFPPGSHAGLVIARLSTRVPAPERTRMILEGILGLKPGEIQGSLIVISRRGVRRRRP